MSMIPGCKRIVAQCPYENCTDFAGAKMLDFGAK
jgi:hypothetical protein